LTLPVLSPQEPATAIRQLKALVARSASLEENSSGGAGGQGSLELDRT